MAGRSMKFDRSKVAEALREGRFEDISIEERNALADLVEPKRRGPSQKTQEIIKSRNKQMARLIKKLKDEGCGYEKIIETILKMKEFDLIGRSTVKTVITRLNKGEIAIDYVNLVTFVNTASILRNIIGEDAFDDKIIVDSLLRLMENNNTDVTTELESNDKDNEISDKDFLKILKPRFGLRPSR